MARILITGMSGTGKSTVLAELARRGYRVVDTDYDGFSEEVDHGDGPQQLWVTKRIDALLAEPGTVVLAGCVSNQGEFYHRLDGVVLLSAPPDVLLDRLARRGTNGFGKSPEDVMRILRDLEEAEPALRATSTIEIVTTAPVTEVVDAIEALLA